MTMITGAGGGKGGNKGSSRTPKTAADSLDSRQYANVIDLISEGEIEGLVDGNKSIYLNNTPLQNTDGSYNFQDVEVYTRNGTQGQSYIPLAAGVETEKQVGLVVVKDVPVARTITDPDVDAVRITISLPALQRIKVKSGDVKGTTVELAIAIKYGAGSFITKISGADGTISGRTGDPYQKDYLIELDRPNPSDNVIIQVSRVTDDSENNQILTNEFIWSSYTEITWAKLTYPNSALVGLRVDAEQFSSIPSRSYLIKGVKVQIPRGVEVDQKTGRIIYPVNYVWDGTFSSATWTSCPAWTLWDLLNSRRYGFGDHIDTAKLDKWAFFAASKYANELVDDGYNGQEARFSCNTTIQTAEEAFKLINDLLSVMRCQGFWSSGSMTIAQDRPEDPTFLFTSANVSPEGFSYSSSSLKTRPNVVVVSYLDIGRYDETGTWRDGSREIAYEAVEDAEMIDKYGIIKSEISAFACTSRGQANRIGRWMLYSERYEHEVVSFSSSLHSGQQVRPGQVILIADPVKAGSRRAGRISAATTTTVTVDDQAGTDLSYDGSSTLAVTLPDGTTEIRGVSTIVNGVITVQSAYTVAPATNGVWMLEKQTLEASTWRVLSIQEQGGIEYTITALKHNEGKYAYVENGDPLQLRDITNLNQIPDSPSGLDVIEATVNGVTTKEVQYELNGRIAVKITFGWLGPKGIKNFRVKYRHEDDNFTTVRIQGTTFDIEDAKEGAYEIQVSSISPSDLLYSIPALATYTVQGLSAPPQAVTGLSLVPLNESIAMLTWTQAADLDVRVGGKVIIRHDPRPLATAEWAASTQIVDAVAGNATQKQVPLLPGTYFVKFEDYIGNRSVDATGFEVALPQYESRLQLDLYVALGYSDNFYDTGVQWEEQSLSPPFSGTAVNGVYDSTETALVIAGGDEYVTTGYWNEIYTLSGVLSPYCAIDYWEPIYTLGDLQAEYYFSETLDMGAVYDVSFRRYVRIRPISAGVLFDSAAGLFDDAVGFFDGTGVDATNLIIYVRSTNDNPAGTPTWGPWTEAINCIAQGRAFQVKAVLTTTSDLSGIAVEELSVIPELLRRVTSSDAPLRSNTVTFGLPFFTLYSVGITPLAMQSTERYVLSNASRTGFSVNFYSGTASLEQEYNYTATGYGRAI